MLQPRIPVCVRAQPTALLRTHLRTYATRQNPIANASKKRGFVKLDSEAAKYPKFIKIEVQSQSGLKWKTGKTNSTRFWRRPIHDHLWKGRPYYPLTSAKKGQARGGRNNTGRVTVRHRGGGHKRRLREVDFVRKEAGIQTVVRIEYDPNRSAHIALIKHRVSGKFSYILAPDGLRAGDKVESFRSGLSDELMSAMGGSIDPGILASKTVFRGNCMPIHMVPLGQQVHNIGNLPNGKAVFCRSAGTFGIVEFKQEVDDVVKAVHVRLQSGEIRSINPNACATIGVASNTTHNAETLGKAGRSRWLGIRPTVRGLAMNASDHPHGGGRGKSKGNRIPVSPWGTQAKSGYKTRKKRNANPFLVKERERNQGKRRVSKQ